MQADYQKISLQKKTKNRLMKKKLIVSLSAALSCSPVLSAADMSNTLQLMLSTRPSATAPASAAQLHTQAVELARGGDHQSALTILDKLHMLKPQDSKIRADYLSILNWDKQHNNVIAVAQKQAVDTLPNYGLTTIVQSARALGSAEIAIEATRELLNREPANKDYQLSHALVLIDNGYHQQADKVIGTLKELYPDDVDVLNTQIFLGQETNSLIKLIDASERLLSRDPKNKQVAITLANAASELGATAKAKEIAERYQFNAAEMRGINARYAAMTVRHSSLKPKNLANPYAEVDTALATLDLVCNCKWEDAHQDKSKRKLVFDRMLALFERHRYSEVIDHYEQFKQHNIEIPLYALNTSADAYLASRKPLKALPIYQTVIDTASNSPDIKYNAQIGQYYALIESEQFDLAYGLIQQLTETQPEYLNRQDNPVVVANEFKIGTDNAQALGLAYGDLLAESDTRITKLLATGPYNSDLQTASANVKVMRDWPRAAKQQFKAIKQNTPADDRAAFALADIDISLQSWASAERQIAELNARHPATNPEMTRLNKRWARHNQRALSLSFSTNKFNGIAIGDRSTNIDARIYSRPFNNNYRAYIANNMQYSEFVEGNGFAVTPRIGLEYRLHDWRLAGEVGVATADANGGTGAIEATYNPNDKMQFDASLQINSLQMPLRGRRVDVTGDQFSAGFIYRWSELTQAGINFSLMDMSDTNTRRTLNAFVDRRVYTSPHYKANLHSEISASRNKQVASNYFNPRRAHFLNIGLRQNWLTWRDYDRHFMQVLDLGIGEYWQDGFGGDSAYQARYIHRWQLEPEFNFEYGVGYRSQPYDGEREDNYSLFGGINLLF